MTSAKALLRSFKGIASAVALIVFVVFMPSAHTTSDDWRWHNHNFQPFGGFADDAVVMDGRVYPPEEPGIGFETRSGLYKMFHSLLEGA